MAIDPRTLLDEAPMTKQQIAAVAVAVGLNAIDGFDVLSISFAAPLIAKEWGIDKLALGTVLAMELIGMAVGSVVLGGLADKVGRRPTMLGCLIAMALGMLMAARASGIVELSVWRVVTGLGIGGMLAATNAVTAEFSNRRRRNLALAIMVIGYPLGAVIGGAVAALLLQGGDWRVVFLFGAGVTLTFIPLTWWLVPEPVQFLITRRRSDALARVNHTLARLGYPSVDALPERPPGERRTSIADILRSGLRRTTLLLTTAYFAHIVSFYFIIKWAGKIVADLGYSPSLAATVLVWANLGGAVGGVCFGILSQRWAVRRLTTAALIASTALLGLFGILANNASLVELSALAFVAQFFSNSAVVGLYTMFARGFPAHVRATGTGFAIGIGRGGAALSPIAAGALFAAGVPLSGVAIGLAAGSLVAAIALAGVRTQFN